MSQKKLEYLNPYHDNKQLKKEFIYEDKLVENPFEYLTYTQNIEHQLNIRFSLLKHTISLLTHEYLLGRNIEEIYNHLGIIDWKIDTNCDIKKTIRLKNYLVPLHKIVIITGNSGKIYSVCLTDVSNWVSQKIIFATCTWCFNNNILEEIKNFEYQIPHQDLLFEAMRLVL